MATFLLRKPRSRQHEAVLTACGLLIDSEALTRVLRQRNCHAGNALSGQEALQQVADRAPGWIDGRGFAAKPGNDAGDVDAPTAGIAPN